MASWLLLISSSHGEEGSNPLVATACDGNRAAIQSIASMECRYERKPWANTSFEQARKCFLLFSPGRFWRSGDTYRLFEPRTDGTTLDYLIRNGLSYSLQKGGPLRRPQLSFETVRPISGVGGDMWQWLLFSHWGWDPPSYYPLEDILQHPHVIRMAERLASPANDIHIELMHNGGQLEFWFDPKVNYLIRKSVIVPAGDKNVRWEHEVIEFAELAPTVFVPVSIEHRCSVKETLQAVIRTTLSEVKVNQPLPQNALRLPGIEGMDCLDLNHDVRFKVDADGNQVGSERSVKVARIAPTGMQSEGKVGDPNAYKEPSKSPTPLWVWVLIASLTVLIATLLSFIVRRRRQALHT